MIARDRDGDGSVTLEVALVTPVVALLVVGVVGLASVVTDQLAAERAARALARAAAVGTPDGVVGDALPAGATVRRAVGTGAITVEVVIHGDVMGVPYTVSATASSPLEPALR